MRSAAAGAECCYGEQSPITLRFTSSRDTNDLDPQWQVTQKTKQGTPVVHGKYTPAQRAVELLNAKGGGVKRVLGSIEPTKAASSVCSVTFQGQCPSLLPPCCALVGFAGGLSHANRPGVQAQVRRWEP